MLYLTIDIFIDALVLVLHDRSAEAKGLVDKLLGIYDEQRKDSAYVENEFFEFYADLLREIVLAGIQAGTDEAEVFILRFKSSPQVTKDPELLTTLKKIFLDKAPMSLERNKFLFAKVANAILWYQNAKSVKKMFGKLANNQFTSPEKQQEIFSELNDLCTDIVHMNQSNTAALANEQNIARVVDFSDKNSIAKALEVYSVTDKRNVFHTGLQGMNKALGPKGGFCAGDSIVFNSLSHSGKSLLLLKMARWQIMYNKAPAEFRNPTVIIFSLENETPKNTMQLFNEMYVNLFNMLPPEDMPQEKIISLCYEHFNTMGWRLVVDRRLGAEFGFGELVACFEEYLRLGYTPLMCVIDYMNMMKKSDADRNDLMIRELYTNVRNYLNTKNCTLVTAHQLNRKAAECVRQNPMGAVKRFDSSMLSDAMDPQREVDIVFYLNKEVDAAGHPFLTFKLDKHRYDTETPEGDKYFAYAFHGPLGIVDDINGASRSCKNIFAYDYEKHENELHGKAVEKTAETKEDAEEASVNMGTIDLIDSGPVEEAKEEVKTPEPVKEVPAEPKEEKKKEAPPQEEKIPEVEVDAKAPAAPEEFPVENTGFIVPKPKKN